MYVPDHNHFRSSYLFCNEIILLFPKPTHSTLQLEQIRISEGNFKIFGGNWGTFPSSDQIVCASN